MLPLGRMLFLQLSGLIAELDMLQGTTGKQIESFKEIATSVFRIKSARIYHGSIG